jgi:hypothetical protein
MEVENTGRFRRPPIDATVPIQFWSVLRNKDFAQPEKNLMLAVLNDAVWHYKKNIRERNARFREAREWLFGENSKSLFSFECICEMLNLNSRMIRQALLCLDATKSEAQIGRENSFPFRLHG